MAISVVLISKGAATALTFGTEAPPSPLDDGKAVQVGRALNHVATQNIARVVSGDQVERVF